MNALITNNVCNKSKFSKLEYVVVRNSEVQFRNTPKKKYIFYSYIIVVDIE